MIQCLLWSKDPFDITAADNWVRNVLGGDTYLTAEGNTVLHFGQIASEDHGQTD